MKGLTKSDIEYLDYNWSLVTGCAHTLDECPVADVCWAKRIAGQYKKSFAPQVHPEALLSPLSLKKPSIIGVCFTGDLFGGWVDLCQEVNPSDKGPIPAGESLIDVLLKVVDARPEHRFLFLTKNPGRYQNFCPWPDNAWVGASVWDAVSFSRALIAMELIKAHKWLSIEPVLKEIGGGAAVEDLLAVNGIQWLVIGTATGTKAEMETLIKRYPALTLMPFNRKWSAQPPLAWVREIVEAAGRAGVRVWLKENLRPLLIPEDCSKPNALMDSIFWSGEQAKLRQERPE